MNTYNNNGLKKIKQEKYLVKNNRLYGPKRYNSCMDDNIAKNIKDFADNISDLRARKGISAREMSLSIGQSASYINDIENGRILPSMAMFFEICSYLEVTPKSFFSYTEDKTDENDNMLLLPNLKEEDKKLIKALIKRLKEY